MHFAKSKLARFAVLMAVGTPLHASGAVNADNSGIVANLPDLPARAGLPTGADIVSALGMKGTPAWKETPFNIPEATRIAVQPVAPFAFTRISSGFGNRADPKAGDWRHHAGLDLPGLMGTPIHASQDGMVAQSGYAGGYGLRVKIDHGRGVETLYGHLSGIAVNPGSQVFRGQIIGFLGSTGRSTGPHLHFEVRSWGRPADPMVYLTTGWSTPFLKAPAIEAMPTHVSAFAQQRSATLSENGRVLPGSL